MAEQQPVAGAQAGRGSGLGLPVDGPNALASTAPRIVAFLVDCVAAALVASLFVGRSDLPGLAGRLPGSWSLVPLGVDYLVGLALTGQTLGMHLAGLRVVAVGPSGPHRARLSQIVIRTVLLFVLIPAVIFDRDGRGLHDRLSQTAVVRA